MTIHTFESTLIRPNEAGSWTYLIIPFDVEAAFGTKAQVKVCGTINGAPFRSSIMALRDGTHYMVVNRELRDAIGVTRGDTVRVELELDTAPRVVDVPDDLAQALAADQAANAAFERMSYSHKKEYVDWITSAKTEATRQRRVQGTIEKINSGQRVK